MPFDTLHGLYFVVSVFVPGFIYLSVLSRFVQRRQASLKEAYLLELFMGSAVTYAVCSPIVYPLISGNLFSDRPYYAGVTWFFVLFLAPVLLAGFVSYGSQRRWLKNMASWFGLTMISPQPTAWDWIFGLQQPMYLLVTLKDDTRLAGYFGTESMAASELDKRDLYLEKAYQVLHDAPWVMAPRTFGIYIPGSEIAYIEFFKIKDSHDEE